MTRDETYASLADAFEDMNTPIENRELIRRFTDFIGIQEYRHGSTYIRAVRSGTGPTLHIAYGYTNGFASEEEVVAAAGDIERWASARMRETWGITHPRHGHGSGGGGAATSRMGEVTCPDCGMVHIRTRPCDCGA